MELIDLLTRLSETDAPSGFEEPAAALAAELLRPYADEITTDALGNVIAVRKCGREGAVRVLLDAHIDEIGFIVTGAQDGFLRFAALGGADARVLPASTLKMLTDPPIYGVVDVLPPHVQSGGDADKALKIEDLYIDAGGAEVPVGTPAVFSSAPARLGENLFCGKALDDRACFAAIVRALELSGDTKLDFDLYILASAQEEVGMRGARTAAFSIAPDFAVIADLYFGDQPDVKEHETQQLGSGAAVSHGPNMNRALTQKIIETAKKEGIPFTVDVEPGGSSGTNASVIQVARAGAAAALIGVPTRYMHTPSEAVDLRDVDALARLLCASLKGGVFHA
ncbi:MAG: M20/M25/M40 family metallo-hydrolase [Oscillospiraceae bacterium]|jgi:endoglucanase|nr:M20/M25/M40 family metallo-hydrolase [Oscillospiraceae bacterium]